MSTSTCLNNLFKHIRYLIYVYVWGTLKIEFTCHNGLKFK